jgi:hypothetical protein
MITKGWSETLEGRDYKEEASTNDRIILKWFLVIWSKLQNKVE